jgi:phosphoglycolate phosphatase
MPRRFDLVILDLDGTLVDSESLLVGLVNQTLRAAGRQPAPPRSVAALIGLPLPEVFRHVAPDVSAEGIAALCTEYRAGAVAADFVSQFRLYAEVAATLAELRARAVHIAIGTSKGRATTLDILAHCAIEHCVDAVIGGDCVERGKPHPEMVDHARQRFAVARERTVMVGDTSFDIAMGKAAGVATCAVTYGMHDAAALRQLQPDYVIDRFDALRHVVFDPA